MTEIITPELNLQESAIATAMLHRVGTATVNFALEDGLRVHQNPRFEQSDFARLAEDFRTDPKESLAFARESLFAITDDDRLTADKRDRRIDRYFDAYVDLTLKLDHEAFPSSAAGEVNEGTPDYVPDGFVDMGGNPDIEDDFRSREMIWVDKGAILQKYKPLLTSIFKKDMKGFSLGQKKKAMVEEIAAAVYFSMPYDYDRKKLGGGKLKLSEISDTVCRHHALVFQVLNQAMGIKSRLLKSYVSAEGSDTFVGRHSTNMVRVNGQWYIFDTTAPDYVTKNGKREWRPGVFSIDGLPKKGKNTTWNVTERFNKEQRTYTAHDSMYWFIDNK